MFSPRDLVCSKSFPIGAHRGQCSCLPLRVLPGSERTQSLPRRLGPEFAPPLARLALDDPDPAHLHLPALRRLPSDQQQRPAAPERLEASPGRRRSKATCSASPSIPVARRRRTERPWFVDGLENQSAPVRGGIAAFQAPEGLIMTGTGPARRKATRCPRTLLS
jgi:hypothetical protein